MGARAVSDLVRLPERGLRACCSTLVPNFFLRTASHSSGGIGDGDDLRSFASRTAAGGIAEDCCWRDEGADVHEGGSSCSSRGAGREEGAGNADGSSMRWGAVKTSPVNVPSLRELLKVYAGPVRNFAMQENEKPAIVSQKLSLPESLNVATIAERRQSTVEAFQVNRLSVERLLWTRHSPWIRHVLPNIQAQNLRFLSSSSTRYHLASPDLSLGTSSLDQDKLDPFSLVADELANLGHKLRAMVAAEVPRLAEAAEYFFKLGVEGKRFRPMVLLLMASALTAEDSGQFSAGGKHRERQQQIAEITEMIHYITEALALSLLLFQSAQEFSRRKVASLLHDDVLDHADTRRGIGSLNHVMGNKLAVLAGDFLLARASVALASLHNSEVVELLSKVLEHLVTGEIMQLTTETEEICSMNYYMQKTFYKTASLMANSCKSIALLAEQPKDVADLAFDYGRHLGLAFQLVDDSLDFIGTKASLGKPTLSDLAQGIATAPVLFALEEHPQIYNLVNRKFRKSGDVDKALEMVRNSKGILRTQQLAAHHAHQANLAIARLPPSSSERVQLCRRALSELTEHVITRSK